MDNSDILLDILTIFRIYIIEERNKALIESKIINMFNYNFWDKILMKGFNSADKLIVIESVNLLGKMTMLPNELISGYIKFELVENYLKVINIRDTKILYSFYFCYSNLMAGDDKIKSMVTVEHFWNKSLEHLVSQSIPDNVKIEIYTCYCIFIEYNRLDKVYEVMAGCGELYEMLFEHLDITRPTISSKVLDIM